jgi:ligand-binding sensor domain-containing protein/signal transduction histidine kinase
MGLALTRICLLCLLATAPVSAQYRFDNWNTDNGLPHNSIFAILQTRDGYLWLTTLDGLVRFDGARFTVFNAANTKDIPGNRMTALFEDREGALWIGTENDGLLRYSAGRFTNYTTNDGLPYNGVIAIQDDANGDLLISTNLGIARRHQGRFTVSVPRTYGSYRAVDHRDRSGAIWYGDQNGLHRLKDGVTTRLRIPNLPISYGIYAISEDRAGNLWIGAGTGLIRLRGEEQTLFTEKDGLPNRVVTSICEDRNGNLWVGTSAGLCLFRDNRFSQVGNFRRQIFDIAEDREGTLWIASWGDGLFRLTREALTVYTDKDGMAANNVYPIYEDRAGVVWIGTWERGLTRCANGRFSHFTTQTNNLPGPLVMSFAEDRDGRLWIGSIGGVVWLKDGKLTDFTSRLGLPHHLAQAILHDRAGNSWFGTNLGLVRVNDWGRRLYTTKEGLAGNDVKTIIEDRQGSIWVGGQGGLTRIAGDELITFNKQSGPVKGQVRALYEDRDGVIWIGTYDGGLSRYKDGKLTNYTTADGLFNNGVFQILEDGLGNLWISCNLGIYRIIKQQLNDFADGKIKTVTSIVYGKSDGLINPECNGGAQPSGVRTRDGKLWFPTQHGVAVIDPEKIPFNPHPPPVIIEDCLLDRVAADISGPVVVKPGQQNIEIRYTALSFIKPELIRFRYKLEGLNQDWVEAGARRSAYYDYLPPGAYTFIVLAANSDGVWNETGAQLRLVVLPPFYRTWWFLTLAALGVIGAAMFFYRRRVAQLRRAHAVQEEFSRRLIESQEAERQRIAAELHDGLGQRLLIIKNQASLSLCDDGLEGARQGLKEISEYSSQAIEEVREIARNLRPYHLDRLGLTRALQAMIKNVAASSAIRFSYEFEELDRALPPDAQINLYRIVQECVNNIVKHADATEATIQIKNDGRRLRLIVSDNGKGFAPDSASRGFGLTGIAERVRILGGRHVIQSAPGAGATIIVIIGLAVKGAVRVVTDDASKE